MDYINNIEKINTNKNIEKETYEKEKQNKYEIENINKKIETISIISFLMLSKCYYFMKFSSEFFV